MSSTINPYTLLGTTPWWNTQNTNSFWDLSNSRDGFSQSWEVLANQCDVSVSLSLEKVSDRLLLDLAGETADYLSDKTELAEDYCIVVTGDNDSGREARAYRISDLLERVDEDKREEIEKQLKEERLLFFEDDEGIPDTPEDDEELQGLADVVQGFLDKNEKVINMLSSGGCWPGE